MHVLFICNEYPPHPHGGVGSFDQTLARELVRTGHRATVVGIYRGLDHETVECDEGVDVIRLPAYRSRVPMGEATRAQRLLWERIREANPDVIDGTELSYWLRPRTVSAPCVIRLQGGHHFFSQAAGIKPRFRRGLSERRSFAKADAFIGVSEYVVAQTETSLSYHGKPVAVIPNAIEISRFAGARTEEEQGLVFFVGTLCQKKGVEELVDAFGLALEDHPDLRLVLAGRDSIDPRTGASFRLGLERRMPAAAAERVAFIGTQPNDLIADYMGRSTLTVLPSHMETFGIVWAEAMASGAALIASRTGPGPEVVEEGVTGLLVDPFDPSSIADAMARLLEDHELAAQLRAAATIRAADRYSVTEVARLNLDFWESL